MIDRLKQNLDRMIFEADSAPRVAIGVSGGSDSVALLVLACEWAKIRGATIVALTVNHQMRSDSLSDCLFVKHLSDKLGVQCNILTWQHENITSNVQAKARHARYLLMTDFCKKHDVLYLCLGHHEDDVVENFVLRLMRSSTAFGFGMREVTFVNEVIILRPILSFKKEECIEFLKSKKISWREDLSNQNHKFTRNKVRSELSCVVKHENLISTQEHLQNLSKTILRDHIIQSLFQYVFISELGYAAIQPCFMNNVCQEMQHIIIAHLVTIICGARKTPSLKTIKLLWEKIKSCEISSCTVHGCLIARRKERIFIIRAFGKENVPAIRLTDNALWDKRFRVNSFSLCEGLAGPYFVDKLEFLDAESLRSLFSQSCIPVQVQFADDGPLYARFLESLPVIKDAKGDLVKIPYVFHRDENVKEGSGSLEVTFCPGFVSNFVHFI